MPVLQFHLIVYKPNYAGMNNKNNITIHFGTEVTLAHLIAAIICNIILHLFIRKYIYILIIKFYKIN